MSTPKLYLIIIRENIVDKITTYRELDTVQNAWSDICDDSEIGVVHCGFSRPSIPEKLELSECFNGKILYTGSVKWALPDFFKSSCQPVQDIALNGQSIPCYLALNQWGYEALDTKETRREVESPISVEQNKAHHKDTLSLAAQQVLQDGNNQPLTSEEIYARIIVSDYYQFNTPTPIHVLDVTLNRETIDSEYSKSAKVPIYGKTEEGRYYLLENNNVEQETVWAQMLDNEGTEVFHALQAHLAFDEESYLNNRHELPDELNIRFDTKRFEILKSTIDLSDPYELLQISPLWLLKTKISDINFTARIENVFLEKGIDHISDLSGFTVADLMMLPNMGRNSIDDICDALFTKIENTTGYLLNSIDNGIDVSLAEHYNEDGSDSIPFVEQISQVPLRQHVNRTLEELDEVDREILHCRLGYKCKVHTLEEIGGNLGITRERVRQRQKKYVERIIDKEYWDDVIGLRIGQLLLDRGEPLLLEMLEVEDPWFEGFMDDSYTYLANVIQMFSENAIQVTEIAGRNVVTRIAQKDWDELVKEIKNSLKQKAKEEKWSRGEIRLYVESCLAERSSRELLPLVQEILEEFLQFDGEEEGTILIAYGKNAESVVKAVLAQADGPLHFTEIAKRATELLGKKVEERRAHNAVSAIAWPFDRGTYGLIEHCPLPEPKRKSIRQIVEYLMYDNPINKQWHSKEIIEQLNESFPAIPDELDPYVLRMCLENSEKINFLNRMVWARSDSGLSSDNRVDVADAFVQILEEAGEPLSGRELKRRLSESRGVDENMQIQPTERLLTVAPNVWGLKEWS